MALAGSNDAEIIQLQEVCGVNRQQAVALLNKYKTLEAAANAFFTDPTAALKDEPPQNEWVPADNLPGFQIEAEDTINIPPMSRPPSRMDNKTNVEAAVGQQFVHQQYKHDEDLSRVIAISKTEMPSQESGVVQSNQQFGPATRTHYDTDKWAVTAIASTRELIDHPPPSKRRRIGNHPTFLRGSQESGYLAPLLNIYYHIPLARQAFLFPSFDVQSYGYDPNWWSGMSDENTKSLSVEASTFQDTQRHNFLAELQCLMAFLQHTTRAYGSVDALADLNALKSFVSETSFSRFIESWIASGIQQDPGEQLTQIFTSKALKALPGPHVDYDNKDFHVLAVPVEHPLSPTLMDLMDNIIWHDSMGTVDDIWIERCAQVFTMRLHGSEDDEKGIGLDIPSVWYPQRYMSAYKDAAREMRTEVLQLQKQIKHCELMQRRCRLASSGSKRTIKIRDVLEAASRLSAEVDPIGHPSSDQTTQMQARLQSVIARLDQKLDALSRQKELLQEEVIRVSRSLATPAEDAGQDRHMKYVLQGVSTKPTITYVRVRSIASLELIDTRETPEEEKDWKWWRFEWLGSDSKSEPMSALRPSQNTNASDGTPPTYDVREVSERDVLQAARDEHNTVVLVYADQQAISCPDPPIKSSLKRFVEQDNRSFEIELDEEAGITARRLSRTTSTTMSDDIVHEDVNGDPESDDMDLMSTASLPGEGGAKSSLGGPMGTKVGPNVHDFDDELPSYEAQGERAVAATKGQKIGLLADQMLEKYGSNAVDEDSGPVHIEHSQTPLR